MSAVSAKLLQGWAMLDTSCPMEGCYAPLMRDRAGGVWCVECGMEVRPEPPRPSDDRAERRDRASKRIGEKLLAGWTMMESLCSQASCSDVGVPLMKQRGSGDLLCVLCEEQTQERPKKVNEDSMKNETKLSNPTLASSESDSTSWTLQCAKHIQTRLEGLCSQIEVGHTNDLSSLVCSAGQLLDLYERLRLMQ